MIIIMTSFKVTTMPGYTQTRHLHAPGSWCQPLVDGLPGFCTNRYCHNDMGKNNPVV